ncbi:MAG: hypothetical protein C4583_06105 [Anaerolineaceae bacterium]|nr:MAG: hypothetical protein C4583_06105 [Anaerolineaceae bacterium]
MTWSLALEEQFYIFLSLFVRNLNRKHLAGLSVFLILLVCLLLCALAELSYRLIEKPIMNWGHQFKYQQLLSPVPSLDGSA